MTAPVAAGHEPSWRFPTCFQDPPAWGSEREKPSSRQRRTDAFAPSGRRSGRSRRSRSPRPFRSDGL